MRADGEAGVVVWPCEIRSLIEALATAAGLLARDAAAGHDPTGEEVSDG
jgi:hypothetical protein